jgi:hypothetical protein
MPSVAYNQLMPMAPLHSSQLFQDTISVARTISTVRPTSGISHASILIALAVVHQDPDIYPNHTLINGSISHVGQFYFQQHFLDELAKVYPYYENKQEVVRNDQDDLFIEASKSGDDPYMKISLIGDKIEDGLYATIDVGVNPKAYRGPAPVNMWTEHGTEPLEDSPWTGYPDTCLACQPPSSSPSAAAQTNVPAKE